MRRFFRRSPVIDAMPLHDITRRDCPQCDGVEWNGPVTCFVCGSEGIKVGHSFKFAEAAV